MSLGGSSRILELAKSEHLKRAGLLHLVGSPLPQGSERSFLTDAEVFFALPDGHVSGRVSAGGSCSLTPIRTLSQLRIVVKLCSELEMERAHSTVCLV
jgi:hypothetical protein